MLVSPSHSPSLRVRRPRAVASVVKSGHEVFVGVDRELFPETICDLVVAFGVLAITSVAGIIIAVGARDGLWGDIRLSRRWVFV